MIKFQYYPAEIKKCRPIGMITLEGFINAIKTNTKNAEIFKQIKQAEEEENFEKKAELKKKLYKFTPCVIVKDWRKYENIVSFTGLLVLDFDHLEVELAKELKQVLFDSCSFIIACWLSPSRHGIKALVKIPICKDVEDFKASFWAIEKELGMIKGFDRVSQNCVQDLFMSYDPDLLYRDDATTFEGKRFSSVLTKPKIIPNHNKDFIRPEKVEDRTDDVIRIIVQNINSINTTGHPKLRSTAFTLGGYVGAGYIDKENAIQLINLCIDNHSYLVQKATTYKKTALTMIENGINYPLTINNYKK